MQHVIVDNISSLSSGSSLYYLKKVRIVTPEDSVATGGYSRSWVTVPNMIPLLAVSLNPSSFDVIDLATGVSLGSAVQPDHSTTEHLFFASVAQLLSKNSTKTMLDHLMYEDLSELEVSSGVKLWVNTGGNFDAWFFYLQRILAP